MQSRKLAYGLIALIIVLAAMQFIHPDRTNPPVDPRMTFEAAAKPSPEVQSIIRRSCSDCHSHSTQWPWYSHIAPVSWLVADDVKEGRRHLNFSTWGQLGNERAQEKLKDICSEVRGGEMPLWIYTLMHSNARLSQADKDRLCKSLP